MKTLPRHLIGTAEMNSDCEISKYKPKARSKEIDVEQKQPETISFPPQVLFCSWASLLTCCLARKCCQSFNS